MPMQNNASEVGNILRALLHESPPHNVENAKEMLAGALSLAMHVMRSCVHTTI